MGSVSQSVRPAAPGTGLLVPSINSSVPAVALSSSTTPDNVARLGCGTLTNQTWYTLQHLSGSGASRCLRGCPRCVTRWIVLRLGAGERAGRHSDVEQDLSPSHRVGRGGGRWHREGVEGRRRDPREYEPDSSFLLVHSLSPKNRTVHHHQTPCHAFDEQIPFITSGELNHLSRAETIE